MTNCGYRSCQFCDGVKIYTVLHTDKSNKHTFLAVDIGNTSVDAAVFRNCEVSLEHWEAEGHVECPLSCTAAELAGMLSGEFHSAPAKAVIGSVAGGFSQTAACAVEDAFGIAPFVADCGMKAGIEVSYQNPRMLGIDRLANAAALFALCRRSCIAVDLGTATTFDCVSHDGCYVGGAITAGLELFRDALARGAPALPQTPLEFPPSVIGRNTEDCIKSGTMLGYARMVDGMVRSLSFEMGDEAPCVVVTGGFASVIAGECETVSQVDSLLTLKGLLIILRENDEILPL